MKFPWKYFLTVILLVYIVSIYYIHSHVYERVAQLNDNYQNHQISQHPHVPPKQTLPHTRHHSVNAIGSVSFSSLKIAPDKTFTAWSKAKSSFCDDNFIGYDNLFAHLRNAYLDPSFSSGRLGGEAIESVLNQPEEKEFLVLKIGYFQINCKDDEVFKYRFKRGDHLVKWISVLRPALETTSREYINTLTIAVTRYEYANVYHTMTDWYNAFLMLVFFNVRSLSANILFVDSHPLGGLDTVWTTLFGRVVRAGQLQQALHFDTLIWNIQGYKSPMYHHDLPSIPHIEPFRIFFLRKHNIPDNKILNCDKLLIRFLWRRDYVAHPRNPKGTVSRKVKNEKEIEDSVAKLYPNHLIESFQTENMSMTDQLSAIVNTDILIGMHGAGLTLALFLPKHAGLIEIYPKYWSSDNAHFRAIARWRNLHYIHWQNVESKNEFTNHYTYVPPSVVHRLLSTTILNMCKAQKGHS